MKQKVNKRTDAPKLERRFLPAQELRVARSDDAPSTLAGYAAVFNSNSLDMGFTEQIASGAFTADLATNPDVRALVNHDPNLILGRTKSGTLKLSQDAVGLKFECQLPNTQVARDFSESVSRGDIDQCSFGMYVQAADWRENPDGSWLRVITQASLFDVSAVTYPAYTATSVSARSFFPDGLPAEVRSHLTATETRDDDDDEAGCTCDCDFCEAGDCEDCDADPQCDHSDMRNLNMTIETSLLRARLLQSL